MLNYIPIFTTLQKNSSPNPRLPHSKGENEPRKGGKHSIFKLILFLLFIIVCVGLYKYNIFNYIINNIFILIYLWLLILIFSIVYNSIGYFILINKNETDIDLTKIRSKFIRNTIESFIAIRNSNLDKEKMGKYFITQLYLSLFLLILFGILILI